MSVFRIKKNFVFIGPMMHKMEIFYNHCESDWNKNNFQIFLKPDFKFVCFRDVFDILFGTWWSLIYRRAIKNVVTGCNANLSPL